MVAAGAIPPVYFRNARVSLEREWAPIRQRLAPMQKRQREIWEMSDGIAHIIRQGANWQDMVAGRANWLNFLVDLQERLNSVEDIWLEDLP